MKLCAASAGKWNKKKLAPNEFRKKTKTNTKHRARVNRRPGQVDFMIGKVTLSNLVRKGSSHPFKKMKTKGIKILYNRKSNSNWRHFVNFTEEI